MYRGDAYYRRHSAAPQPKQFEQLEINVPEKLQIQRNRRNLADQLAGLIAEGVLHPEATLGGVIDYLRA